MRSGTKLSQLLRVFAYFWKIMAQFGSPAKIIAMVQQFDDTMIFLHGTRAQLFKTSFKSKASHNCQQKILEYFRY